MDDQVRGALARLMNNSDFRDHFLGLVRERRDGCNRSALEHAEPVTIYRAQGGHKALDAIIEDARTAVDPKPRPRPRRIV